VSPLDRVLELLRDAALPYRWHESQLSRWDSTCPSCVAGEWNLTIIDHGSSVTVRCRSGCSEKQVVQSLKKRPALRVAQEREEVALELAEAGSAIAHRALKLAVKGVAA